MATLCRKIVAGLCGTVLRTGVTPARGQKLSLPCLHMQVAGLASCRLQPKPLRCFPWPYEEKRYNMWNQFYDHTTKRLDENSKIIVIEGNIGVDRADYGRTIAKEFAMEFMPDVDPEKNWFVGEGFDIRSLNEQLPYSARPCDLPTFYEHKAPKEQLMRIGLTQVNMYEMRVFHYSRALDHLLNTGIGVVLDRCPWTDIIFAETLHKLGHITKNGYKYYHDVRRNTICDLWKPHLIIYLDAPTSYCHKQISCWPQQWIAKSPVMNEEFLQHVERVYKEKYLPFMRKHCEVMVWDLDECQELEYVVEVMEKLNLDTPPYGQEEKFEDWQLKREDDWNCYRGIMASKWQLRNRFMLAAYPWDAPELLPQGEAGLALRKVVLEHPEHMYAPGWNPYTQNIYFKF